MADYKYTDVAGSAHTRCYSIVLSNAKGHVPTMRFNEELWYNIPGFEVGIAKDGFQVEYNPQSTIPLLNPITGAALGNEITQEFLQVILYSLYIQQAHLRDERMAQLQQNMINEATIPKMLDVSLEENVILSDNIDTGVV